jgi:hypothetical protein
MDREEEKNQLTEEGVLIWREEGMAMAAVLAIIGRGGLLFVFREESLVCFFVLAKTLLFLCPQNKQWRIIIIITETRWPTAS